MIVVKRKVGSLLSLAAVLVLAGCGGGSDSSSGEVESGTPAAAAGSVAAPGGSTLKIEPAQLHLGTVYTKKSATGTVRLVNSGAEPITIQGCKDHCRCTTTDCPRGKELQPGESTEVDVRFTAGALPFSKTATITFWVVGQEPARLMIGARIIAYVMIDPKVIDPGKAPDGRVVLEATDGQPFRITGMIPPVIKEFAPEPRVRHELFLDWDVWRQLGQTRRLIFYVDHPEMSEVAISVRASSAPRPGS
ncbi:MAG: DUF1573 domain-containing protein [Planctomycetota bacterium]